MDIRDFQGLTKYKVIIPIIYLISWTFMLVGPLYFEVLYQHICVFFLIYTDVKVIILFTIMCIVLFKSRKVFKRVNS